MLHNLVITKPGTADQVGLLAANMGLNGERLNYIPKSSDILLPDGSGMVIASRILNGKKISKIAGAEVVGFAFLVNLTFLKEEQNLNSVSNNIISIVNY